MAGHKLATDAHGQRGRRIALGMDVNERVRAEVFGDADGAFPAPLGGRDRQVFGPDADGVGIVLGGIVLVVVSAMCEPA